MKTTLENCQNAKPRPISNVLVPSSNCHHLGAGRGGLLLPPRQAAGQAGGQPRLRAGRQARLLQGDPQLWRILEIQTKLHEDFAITGKAPTNKTLC